MRTVIEGTGMEKLSALSRERLKENVPAFDPGDTVRVMVRVREGEKERLQAFEGVCIARRGGGISESFTGRKISGGRGWRWRGVWGPPGAACPGRPNAGAGGRRDSKILPRAKRERLCAVVRAR